MKDVSLVWFSIFAMGYSIWCLWRSKRSEALVSPLALYAALALVHFFLPAFLLGLGVGPEFVNPSNRAYALEALVYMFIGLISIQMGVKLAIRLHDSSKGQPQQSFQLAWADKPMAIVVAVLLFLGWGFRVYIVTHSGYFQITRGMQGELEGPFFALIRLIEVFPGYALAIIAVRAFRPLDHHAPKWKKALGLIMIAELVYWIPTGRKEETILIFLIPIIIYYIRTKKLPSKLVTFGIISFVVFLFPISYFYRNAMQAIGPEGEISIVVQTSVSGMEDARALARGDSPVDIFLGRISLVESLGSCLRLKQEGNWRAPFGQNYSAVLVAFIPRYFWPKKPDLHYGTEFGKAAGFIYWRDDLTSASVTFPGEAYLNFGWFGVVPLFFIGSFFGWLYAYGGRPYAGETGMLVYLVAIPTMLYIGGTFAMYFGGLIKIIPVFFFAGKWMEVKKRHWDGPVAYRRTFLDFKD